MTNNSYWDQEEFENLVAKGLLTIYETDINKKCTKGCPKFIKPSFKDILNLRKLGCYFAPEDRDVFSNCVQIDVDGIPNVGIFSNPDPLNSTLENEYMRICYVEKISKLPQGLYENPVNITLKKNIPYKVSHFQVTTNNKLWISNSYITMDQKGNIYDVYKKNQYGNFIVIAAGTYKNSDNEEFYNTDIPISACAFNFYTDRKYLWNVQAKEGIAKATFGVYPEQIKSLFYARELPMTETGRKRPILHWVASHQRRLKKGIDVDIEKHLRGTNEFVYNGTKFKITNPLKELK